MPATVRHSSNQVLTQQRIKLLCCYLSSSSSQLGHLLSGSQSERPTPCLRKDRSSEQKRRANPVSKELKALLVANERWNRSPGADGGSPGKHSSQSPSPPEQLVHDINKDIFFESFPEVKETEQKADRKCFNTDCCTKTGEDVVGRWLYVICGAMFPLIFQSLCATF